MGKSVLGGCRGIIAGMLPMRKVGIVAARYEHVGHEFQYVYKGFRKLFRGRLQVFDRLKFIQQSNYHVHDMKAAWGTEVNGFSTESDDGATLLGREFTDVILGEGSHISQSLHRS